MHAPFVRIPAPSRQPYITLLAITHAHQAGHKSSHFAVGWFEWCAPGNAGTSFMRPWSFFGEAWLLPGSKLVMRVSRWEIFSSRRLVDACECWRSASSAASAAYIAASHFLACSCARGDSRRLNAEGQVQGRQRNETSHARKGPTRTSLQHAPAILLPMWRTGPGPDQRPRPPVWRLPRAPCAQIERPPCPHPRFLRRLARATSCPLTCPRQPCQRPALPGPHTRAPGRRSCYDE